MGSIKENYEMMFTSYPDLVDITQLKEMLGIGITLAYRLVLLSWYYDYDINK